jgi:phenylacetate-CoA ligase
VGVTVGGAPQPAAVEETIRQIRRETIDQGLLFPRIYQAFQEYQQRDNTPGTLRELQGRRLSAVLAHAIAQVPAYRERARAGELQRPDADDPWQALARFPLVDKPVLRARLADHCDDDLDPKSCRATTTSGTTGQPLRVLHDFDHLVHVHAVYLDRNARDGLGFDLKILHPYHTWLDRWVEYTSPAQGYARVALFGATGDAAYWADILDRIRGFRPEAVMGHPSRMLGLCDLLGEPGKIQPLLINTWGERLSAAAADRLAGFFGAPVRDQYGLGELGAVASQCRHGRYHIEAERVWVEVVDPEGRPVPDGTPGEVVVTNLVNRVMPLLRYRTGDIGAITPSGQLCPCGMPQRTMQLIEGRVPADIVTPSGTRIPTMPLFRMLWNAPVERYQIVQTAPDTLRIVVRPTPEFGEDTAGLLRTQAEQLIGDGVRVQVCTDAEFIQHGARKVVDFVPLPEGVNDR